MKKFTTANFANFLKYHTPFSQICQKYGMTENELEHAIKNVYHPNKATGIIRTLRGYDKQARKLQPANNITNNHTEDMEMSKKKKQNQNKKNSQPIPNVPEAIIVADDNLEIPEPNSKLELLQEKEASLLSKLSEVENSIERVLGIKSEVDQNVASLTNEVSELKAIVEDKLAQVRKLRDYNGELEQELSANRANHEQINSELKAIRLDIEKAKTVIISVMQSGIIMINNMEAYYPSVEASDLLTLASFSSLENLTLKQLKQLSQLKQIVKSVSEKYSQIDINFEDETSKNAWEAWKAI